MAGGHANTGRMVNPCERLTSVVQFGHLPPGHRQSWLFDNRAASNRERLVQEPDIRDRRSPVRPSLNVAHDRPHTIGLRLDVDCYAKVLHTLSPQWTLDS